MSADLVLNLERRMNDALARLRFSAPVSVIYNPLLYGKETHEIFIRKYCSNGRKPVIFLGMNPGPFGMVQTAVPFGDVESVREFLGIEGMVEKPEKEHERRPVLGFQCSRKEVSGSRFWGLVKRISNGNPENFFRSCFVHNYCPLAFLDSNGRNITPPALRKGELKSLVEICDSFLLEFLCLLQPEIVVGIGKFAAERSTVVLKKSAEMGVSVGDIRVESILHPSPINPKANKDPGWEAIALNQLLDMGVLKWINGIPNTKKPAD